jgi:hypothetical protein
VETFALHHMLQSKYGKVTSVHTTHVMPRAFWNSPRPGSEPKGDGVFVFWITDTESVPIGTFPTESQLHSTR